MMIGGIDIGIAKQITRALNRKLLLEQSASKEPNIANTVILYAQKTWT